ncbi:MAG: hypothetical protein IMX01_10195 [Limnochordaceae bacterium]|nr:hypothetical protein [Limnochordaceae bacterium]
MGVSRTLPGLADFYMAGQWAEGMIGAMLPPGPSKLPATAEFENAILSFG